MVPYRGQCVVPYRGQCGTIQRSVCGTIQRSVWYHTEVSVVPYRGQCGTIQRSVWYHTEVSVVAYRGQCVVSNENQHTVHSQESKPKKHVFKSGLANHYSTGADCIVVLTPKSLKATRLMDEH